MNRVTYLDGLQQDSLLWQGNVLAGVTGPNNTCQFGVLWNQTGNNSPARAGFSYALNSGSPVLSMAGANVGFTPLLGLTYFQATFADGNGDGCLFHYVPYDMNYSISTND